MIDNLVDFFARFIGNLFQRKGDIVTNIARAEQRGVLIDHANVLTHLLQFPATQPRNFKLFKKDGTGVRAESSEDETQNRAFAAAGLTHNDKAILRLNLKRKSIEHVFLLELHVHVAQLDDMGVRCVHVGKNVV